MATLAWALACLDAEPTSNTETFDHTWEARFNVSATLRASLERSGVFTWDISAYLDPGVDRGVARTVGDTLMVDGKPLAVTRVTRSGVRFWGTRLDVDARDVHERTIPVVPPRVEELPPAGPMMIVGVGAQGGDTLRWTRGTDLVVPISVPARQSDEWPEIWFWSLTVSDPDSSRFRMEGRSSPPRHVLVPGDHLPDGGPLLEAEFFYYADFRDRSTSDSYSVQGSLGGTLRWVVEVLPEPGAADG